MLAGSLLVVMIAASWAVNRFVEQPVSRWLKVRLRASFAKLAAPEAVPALEAVPAPVRRTEPGERVGARR